MLEVEKVKWIKYNFFFLGVLIYYVGFLRVEKMKDVFFCSVELIYLVLLLFDSETSLNIWKNFLYLGESGFDFEFLGFEKLEIWFILTFEISREKV